MTELNLPQFNFRLRSDNDTTYIFDSIRKKELVLTPEEWVRQHIIQTLVQNFDYPTSLLHLEKGLIYNQRNKDQLTIQSNHRKHFQLFQESLKAA